MESPTRALKVNIVVVTTCEAVEHRFRKRYQGGIGKDAVFTEIDIGWWMRLTGSYEAIYVGDTQPRFETGDRVKITLERVDD